MRTLLKVGTVGAYVTRTRRIDGTAFDFSDAKWKVYASAADRNGPTVIYTDRDITSIQSTYGLPLGGVVCIPNWSGAGLPGASTGAVVVAGGDKVTVTAAASADATVIEQWLFQTKADGAIWYLVGIGPDGWLAAGIAIGDPALVPAAGVWIAGLSAGTPGADAVLTEVAPTVDESITEGATAVVAAPAITSAVAAAIGTGTLDAGNHEWKLVNVRKSDSWSARIVAFETTFYDSTTGRRITLPAGEPDEIQYLEQVA